MDTRKLGQTGLEISPLGLGTVKFGRNEGVKYPEHFEIPSEEYLFDLLAHASKLGINLIDTAPSYGISEERLGRLLVGQRRDWKIVGKAGEQYVDGESVFDFTPDGIERSINESLERLKTDHIEMMLLHSCGKDVDILSDRELMDRMRSLKEQGIIGAFGASTKTVEGGIKSIEKCDLVMAAYNPCYKMEEPILDRAAELGKGVLLKKALNSGHLSSIEGVSDPVQEAMDLSFGHAGVTAMIVGTINPNHLEENVKKAEIAIAKVGQ